jgi:hypothetical protein
MSQQRRLQSRETDGLFDHKQTSKPNEIVDGVVFLAPDATFATLWCLAFAGPDCILQLPGKCACGNYPNERFASADFTYS